MTNIQGAGGKLKKFSIGNFTSPEFELEIRKDDKLYFGYTFPTKEKAGEVTATIKRPFLFFFKKTIQAKFPLYAKEKI